MAVTVDDLVIAIKADTGKASKNLERLENQMDELTSAFVKQTKVNEKTSDSFKGIGATVVKMNQAVELASRAFAVLGSTFDKTFSSAVQLQKGVAEVTTLISGDTTMASRQLTKEILELQRQFGSGQADLAKSFYQALSSGAVDASNAQGLLITAQKLAIGGVTTLSTATDGLTSLMNAFGVEAGKATEISDALFIGMRAGKTTISELSGTLGQAAGLAASVGVSFQELIGATSAITTGGVQTGAAVTQVRSAMVGLSKQTPQLTKVLEQLGITSIQAAIEQDGLVGTLRNIVGQTDGTTESLTELFGRIEAVNGILALTSGEIGGKFEQIMQDMGTAAGEAGAQTETAFQKMAETADFRLAVLQGRADAAFTELGQTLLPPVITAMEFFADVTGTAVESIQGLAAAIGRVDFQEIVNNAQVLGVALAGLGAKFAVVNFEAIKLATKSGAATAKAFLSMAGAAAKAAIPMALVAAKAALIAVSVGSLIVVVDLIARNISNLGGLFEAFKDGLVIAGAFITKAFSFIELGAQKMRLAIVSGLELVGLASESAVKSAEMAVSGTKGQIKGLEAFIDKKSDDFKKKNIGIDFGLAGSVMTQLSNLFGETEEKTDAIAKTTEDVNKTDGERVKKAKVMRELLEQQADALADIVKRNQELRLEFSSLNAGFAERLELQLQADLKEVDAQERKLAVNNMLTAQARMQLNIQRDLLKSIASADLAGAQSDALDSVIAKNETIQSQIDTIGTIEIERIQMKLQSDLIEIENMRTKLDLEGKLTAESNARLNKQRDLVTELAQKKGAASIFGDGLTRFLSKDTMESVGSFFGISATKHVGKDAMRKSGEAFGLAAKSQIEKAKAPAAAAGAANATTPSLNPDQLSAIGEAAGAGASGAAGAGAAGAGAGAAGGAAAGLGAGAAAALGPIGAVVMAVEALMKLPEMMSGAANFLEDLINLPENLIASSEKLGEAIVKFFRKLPGLIPALGKALLKMVFEITKAIVVGLVDFIKIAINDILNFLGFDDFFNMDKAEEKLQKFVKNISGSTSRLFEVAADAEEVRGVERAKQLEDAIVGAARKSEDILMKFFRKMGEFGTMIWDGFLKPVANWFGDRGTEIWNSFILPLGNWFGDRGTEIWNGLTTAVGNVATVFGNWGTAIWNGLLHFLENPGEALGNLGTQIWDGLMAAATAIGDLGTAIWNGLDSAATTLGDWGTAIFDGLNGAANAITDFGVRIWHGFIGAIGDLASVFGKWGTEIWNGLKQFVDNPGEAFKDLGGKIAEGFKDSMGGISETLKNAGKKIFEGFDVALGNVTSIFKKIFDTTGGLGQKGGVERALNIDVPFASFNQGGIIPGRPVVNGDSALNDRVVALMSPGEGVIPRTKMQDPIVRRFFDLIMKGKIGENSFNQGGLIGEGLGLGLGPQAIFAGAGRTQATNQTFNFNINVELNNEGDEIDETFIRSRLMPVMQDELRRSSLNGEFVIDERGIRNG